MARHYPNGAGQALGDTLATCGSLHMSGDIWYVHHDGTDAAAPRGLNAGSPLATIAQAQTNAADGDIVVCLDGHAETIGGLTISDRLTIVGAGRSAGKPTVKLTAGAETGLLSISGATVELRNVWIEERTSSSTAVRVAVSGADFRMVDCYMECGALDGGAGFALASGADRCRVINSTFISTATEADDLPESAFKITAAVADLVLDGLVLSGGAYGFDNPYAFDGSAAAITRLRAQSVSLLLGADMNLHASTTGWINVETATGSGRVLW